jgi:hypothetical protein
MGFFFEQLTGDEIKQKANQRCIEKVETQEEVQNIALQYVWQTEVLHFQG